MKKNKFILFGLIILAFFSACSKDDNPANNSGPDEDKPKEGIFVLAAAKNPLVPTDILYTSNTLDSGVLITEGTGIEQDGTYHNYVVNNGLFFSLLFGQGNPGAVTAYKANSKKQLEKVSSFQSETMTAFTVAGDDILMVKNAWQPAEQYTKWFRFDTKTLQIVAQGEIDANALAGNGEKAFFTDLKKVGDKIFAPFWCIESGLNFQTNYQDSAYMAVYSYPDMKLEKVIKDARTGGIGAYFTSGIDVDENGDVYVIGTKLNWDKAGKYSTKTPVAFMKIKKGTTEYDQSYFFNITNVANGEYIYKKMYLGKGNFLLTMCPKPYAYATVFYGSLLYGGVKLAIANVYNGTFKWVTGVPDSKSIRATTEYGANYTQLDGTGYLGIYYTEGSANKSAVFKFDAETATAVPKLVTDGKAAITSINWLPVTE